MGNPSDDDHAPGPLGSLVPGLGEPVERFAPSDLHPRAVQLALPGEGHALVLCAWRAPADALHLHHALRPLVEAAMLSELSRPVEEQREQPRDVRALSLMSFAELPFDPEPALRPFGLSPRPERDATFRAAAALLRAEARRVDGPTPEDPVTLYEAPFERVQDPRVQRAEERFLAEAPGDPWGAQPGVLARGFAEALAAEGIPAIEPTRDGILAFEHAVIPQAIGKVRWISPLAFQALCDLLAVAAHGWGMEVQWGVCEPDPTTRLAPPPLIKARRGPTAGHVPLGEHVLRWCVMPRLAGEDIPPLADWAQHEFTG